MKKIIIIAKKEFLEHLNSGQIMVMGVAFLTIIGSYFVENLFMVNRSTLYHMFEFLPYINMVLIPALTMGSFAGEYSMGTMELLVTLPFSRMEIIWGKILGNFLIYLVLLASTLIHFITLIFIGSPDWGQTLSCYLAAMLLGLIFVSIGIFSSSLSKSSITGFVVAFVICSIFVYLDHASTLTKGFTSTFLQHLSVLYPYKNMLRGVIDLRSLTYFFSLFSFFFYLIKLSFEGSD